MYLSRAGDYLIKRAVWGQKAPTVGRAQPAAQPASMAAPARAQPVQPMVSHAIGGRVGGIGGDEFNKAPVPAEGGGGGQGPAPKPHGSEGTALGQGSPSAAGGGAAEGTDWLGHGMNAFYLAQMGRSVLGAAAAPVALGAAYGLGTNYLAHKAIDPGVEGKWGFGPGGRMRYNLTNPPSAMPSVVAPKPAVPTPTKITRGELFGTGRLGR